MINTEIAMTLLILLLGVSVSFLCLTKLPVIYEFAAFLLVGLLVGVAFTYAMKWKLTVLERVVLGYGLSIIVSMLTGYFLSFFLKNLSFNSFLWSLLLETVLLVGLGLLRTCTRKHKFVATPPVSLSNTEAPRMRARISSSHPKTTSKPP